MLRGEAIQQAHQLIQSRPLWDVLEAKRLKKDLTKVFSGSVVGLSGDGADKARDALFELVTATHLRGMGFEIEPTKAQEDVRAKLPAIGSIVVECKRPAALASVAAALRDARDQIAQRKRDAGFIGLGADRLLGLNADIAVAGDADTFTHTAQETVQQLWGHLHTNELDPARDLWPAAAAIVIVLSTAVVLATEQTVLRFNIAVSVVTVPDEDERGSNIRRAIEDALRRAGGQS